MTPKIERFSETAKETLLVALPNSALVICEPTSNSAAYIEYETDRMICRLTYWEKGSLHYIGIDFPSGVERLTHDTLISADTDLEMTFLAFQNHALNQNL